MKKMIYLFILVFSLSTLVACSDDEGTPVFTEPTEFVLNVPKYASGIYDLKNTATIQLTCSQPDYGFTAATRYTVEIALDQALKRMRLWTPSIQQPKWKWTHKKLLSLFPIY